MPVCVCRLRIPVKRKSAVELRAAMEEMRDNEKPPYYYAIDNETPKQIASKLKIAVKDLVTFNRRSVASVDGRVHGVLCLVAAIGVDQNDCIATHLPVLGTFRT